MALNNDTTDHTFRWQTGLPRGRYCDIVSGGRTCSGTLVSVNSSGVARVTIPAKGVVAVLRASRR